MLVGSRARMHAYTQYYWTKAAISSRDFWESRVSGCVGPRNVLRMRVASLNWNLARANEFVAK